jgi:hypothetical protein
MRLCFISIDANLAHIDFDDFKNEDLQNAFAFSLPSYVSIFLKFQSRSRIFFWGSDGSG